MSEAVAPFSHGHVPVAALRLLSDDRLARKAAEGDRQAFAALYERHHQALYRYCRAILGNPEDAADALQNTMAAALRALPGERRQITVKPWLYRIAHNESITLLRRRAPHAGLEAAVNVAAPRGSDAATRERLRQLVTDLHDLSDRQRAALVMRELNGLGYAEIGAALGSSPAATKQLIYEARTALHELAEGRDMSCDAVRRSLSADDRRLLRGRKLRAHLKACAGCRDFHAMMGSRRRDLAALAPPLPAAAAAALLHGLAAGHGAGSGGGLAGLAGGSAGKAVASSALAKGLTAVAVVATVGAGTAGITGRLPTVHGDRTPAAAPAQGSAPVAPSTRSAGLPAATGSDSRAREHSKRRGPHRGAAQRHGGGKPSQVRDPHAARQHVKRPAKARPPSPGASAGRPGGRPVKRPRSGSDRAAPGRENHVPRKPDITAPVPPEPPELPLQAPTTEP